MREKLPPLCGGPKDGVRPVARAKGERSEPVWVMNYRGKPSPFARMEICLDTCHRGKYDDRERRVRENNQEARVGEAHEGNVRKSRKVDA